MQNEEHNDPVWKLLGQSRPPQPPPFFTAKVLAKIRSQPAPAPWWHLLRLRIPLATGALAAAAIALLAWSQLRPADTLPASPEAQQLASLDRKDLQVVASLDQLLAFEEQSTWTDASY